MKKLSINAASCDVRNVTEETLSNYDKVCINAAAVITNQAAQALLGKYQVSVNAATFLSLEGEVRISVINGPMSITPGQAMPEENLVLLVNGPLDIAPGSEEILRHYAAMTVNGPVSCPESLIGLLSAFRVNGPINAYPDGSIVLKRVTALDRTFHLRARQDALYYAARRVLALDPDIAFDKLTEKNVRFATRQLLVAESLAEAAVPLFDEKTDIVILPDGCAYVGDDAELNAALLKRYGGKLYINGDVRITPESAALLDQITYLRANDLLVCRSLKDRVLEMNFEYDNLSVVGGAVIAGCVKAQVTAAVLAGAEDGLSVMDCAKVVIGEDVTPELLRENLVGISCCAKVICAAEEQMGAVEPLTRDVVKIILAGEEEPESDDNEDEDGAGTVFINAASYTL